MDMLGYKYPNMSWKRALIVGCSHGIHADPTALDAILRFRDEYKPRTVVHLGDFTDTTAFRAGAKGTSDEAESIPPDVDAGLRFLKALRPKIVFCGNHEARVWNGRAHYNAVYSYACGQVVNIIEKVVIGQLRSDLVTYDGVWNFRKLANYTLVHGTFYNENATRDHAELYGNVIHAHTHRPAMEKGRRLDNPTGFGVGTLTNGPDMAYANTKKSTTAWAQGFVWGEYNEELGQAQFYLHEQPMHSKIWRLP